MPKPVTLSDIARRSKVSLSTVSLVLRNKPGIPAETRQRVLKAAQALGYKFKAKSAKSAESSRSNTNLKNLGLIIKSEPGEPPQTNPFYSQVLAGVEDACRKFKVNLLFATLPVDENNIPTEPVPLISQPHIDGIIFVGTVVDGTLAHLLHESKLPVVLLDAYTLHNDFDSVLSDNLKGAYEAVTHLIQCGHRHIGLIGSGPKPYPSLKERREGYLNALREHGIKESYIAESAPNGDAILQATTDLLQKHPNISALFACNDHAALIGIRAAQALGRRIPQDLSIIGFDDIELAEHLQPPLTTMRVDKVGLGRVAVQALLNRIEFPDSEHITTILSPRLIQRATVENLT